MDGLGELDLLRGEVAVGVARELVGQDQQVVQRRAQLVRHVREELGLVLRGERELRGLLLQRLPGLLHLAVLALHLLVLVGEQARLLLQLLVGLLQLTRASDCDCLSRFSVRVFASIVLITMPIDSVSWSRNAWCVGLKRSSEASSITPCTWPSNTTGSTSTSAPRPRRQARSRCGSSRTARREQDLAASRSRTGRPGLRRGRLACRARAGRARRSSRAACSCGSSSARVQHVELGLLRADHRRQLGQDHLADRVRSRWPCSMRQNLARLVFSQSCSVFFCVVSLAGCGSSR